MVEFERTFDNAAANYEVSRPIYMKELYGAIFKYTQINSSSNVLEIGIGTGKATLPILEKRCNLIALEPGEQLAKISNEKFQKYDNFLIHNQTLQNFTYPANSFNFIYSATAFHWISEEYGYKRVYELLKEGGVFARFAYHAGQDKRRKALTSEIQELYKKYMNFKGEPKEYGEDEAKKLAQIAERYGFVDTKYYLYHMTKDFTADEYMGLLKTYPDHMEIEKTNREKLFNGIHTAINKNGGVITVYYTVDLELARKV